MTAPVVIDTTAEPGTFRCAHMTIGNVIYASCAICGPMSRVAPVLVGQIKIIETGSWMR